ncbi:MAG: tyrosine-type recombinase/integrase [Defluviitaleaceae bacterium]|nr:tyrosine-type recombinase/integrase [Defluviitaleaceae bacterium]
MRDCPDVKRCAYSGILAPHCEAFIAEKRAVGYTYRSEAEILGEFSRFSVGFDIPPNTLTESVVKAWIAQRPIESDRTRYHRFSIVKLFAEYLLRMGYPAYVPSVTEIGKRHEKFVPYIFTHDEIKRFFLAADSMHPYWKTSAPRRHQVMPVLFRLLYCCGLRVSEATGLLGGDVDLRAGILTIRDSKFNKNRYVPMSEEMTSICVRYAKTRLVSDTDDWFFAARHGGRYGNRTVYTAFRELLLEAGISHGGRGKGPRVHDMRHTFAVHCLQKWTKDGANITTALPYLREYLGHNTLDATERYLRMTAEVYPEISALMQEEYGHLVPREGVVAI